MESFESFRDRLAMIEVPLRLELRAVLPGFDFLLQRDAIGRRRRGGLFPKMSL